MKSLARAFITVALTATMVGEGASIGDGALLGKGSKFAKPGLGTFGNFKFSGVRAFAASREKWLTALLGDDLKAG
jgi:hypothetical protein